MRERWEEGRGRREGEEGGRGGREGGRGGREGGREGGSTNRNFNLLCRTNSATNIFSCVQSYSCYLHGPKDGEWFPGKGIPQF